MKSQDLTITILSTEDNLNASEIILDSFVVFLQRELRILAVSKYFDV